METVLSRCWTLYTVALEQRKTWRQREQSGHSKSATYYQQQGESPDLNVACPEYAAVHAPVLQDVILRVERTHQAFFRRVKQGKQPDDPRFQGRNRYTNFTYPHHGGGAALDGGLLNPSKIGRIHVQPHRPLAETPQTVTISREADGWRACISCAEAPTLPLPLGNVRPRA
jgi:putative transposase